MRFDDYIEIYFLGLVACVAIVAAYYHLARIEVRESDREKLSEANLNLEVILIMLEAPDTQYLMSKSGRGKFLFTEYSRSLRADVLGLIRTRDLGLKSYGLVAAFYVTYGVMSLKSKLSASLNDIRVLSALELRLVRSLVV